MSPPALSSALDPYQRFVGPLLAADDGADPEMLSSLSLGVLRWTSRWRHQRLVRGVLRDVAAVLRRDYPQLECHCMGLRFPNPVGLAAGFDKDAVAAAVWHCFGFGFAELGTFTALPQRGNPQPRLFRLAAEQAALNRMGFNNHGSARAVATLAAQTLPPPGRRPALLGFNIGKSKATALSAANDDYAVSYERLAPLADYVVVNVSSPNTPGLRELQTAEALNGLIRRLHDTPPGAAPRPPLLVKLAPDLNVPQLDALTDVILRLHGEGRLAGVIATNTSLDRFGLEQRRLITGRTLAEEAGGLSGVPLRSRALQVLRQLRQRLQGQVPLIGVGGIDSPQAAWERIAAGANLLQLYTGWIYRGPLLVPAILDGLQRQLDIHGFTTLAEAVGREQPWISSDPGTSGESANPTLLAG